MLVLKENLGTRKMTGNEDVPDRQVLNKLGISKSSAGISAISLKLISRFSKSLQFFPNPRGRFCSRLVDKSNLLRGRNDNSRGTSLEKSQWVSYPRGKEGFWHTSVSDETDLVLWCSWGLRFVTGFCQLTCCRRGLIVPGRWKWGLAGIHSVDSRRDRGVLTSGAGKMILAGLWVYFCPALDVSSWRVYENQSKAEDSEGIRSNFSG